MEPTLAQINEVYLNDRGERNIPGAHQRFMALGLQLPWNWEETLERFGSEQRMPRPWSLEDGMCVRQAQFLANYEEWKQDRTNWLKAWHFVDAHPAFRGIEPRTYYAGFAKTTIAMGKPEDPFCSLTVYPVSGGDSISVNSIADSYENTVLRLAFYMEKEFDSSGNPMA